MITLSLILLLAVIQGLTEFLPVSSSGHLRLLQAAFGVEDPQTFVDIVLHVGTLVAVLAVYGRDVLRMLASLGRSIGRLARGRSSGLLEEEPDTRLALLILLGSVPAAVVGLLAGGVLERHLTDPVLVGSFLVLNGVILMVGGRSRVGRGDDTGRCLEDLRWRDALYVGLAQSFALLRGISRSGSTISAGLLIGVCREDAARFSFLLSLPAIAGAAVLELRHLGETEIAAPGALVAGAATAAVVGWLALLVLIRLVKRGRLEHFAWYCWALGAAAIVGFGLL